MKQPLRLAACLMLALVATAVRAEEAPPADSCAALSAVPLVQFSGRVLSAGVQQASPASSEGFRPRGPMPEHCQVLGRLAEREGANGQHYAINFRLRLPPSWNGRLFFEGGGGTNGFVSDASGVLMGGRRDNALSLGYAVISQDSGHDNATNKDPQRQGQVTFGFDAEARRNYGGASIGPVVRAGKALLAAFYGRQPELTYFVGGSKGGQEAMMAAQRFPEEFDAVLVGYPGFRLAFAGSVGQIWDAQAFAGAARAMGALGADGQPLAGRAFSDSDLLLVSDAVLWACDSLDGTADGIVENFTACTTRRVAPQLAAVTCKGAKADTCLLPVQIAALRKSFDGARDGRGRQLYSDWYWDAGIAARTGKSVSQGWRMWKLGSYGSASNNSLAIVLGGAAGSAVFTSPPTPLADNPGALTAWALGADVAENARAARAKWGALGESAADFMNADATDLSRFTRRGGKMLIYHGVSDPVFSIKDTIAWLKQVDAREHGKASRFVRLYAVPGMNHGGGGPATDQFDPFGALVAWREHGSAPEALVATAGSATPWPGRTRLLCPYPQQPRRVGSDIESVASFRCVKP